jgi:AcrR family transcriptional regulator
VPKPLSSEQVDEFRDRLCATATRLFAERGKESVTMRQLAAELGCSPMTPYRYFRDKEEILAAVRAAAFDRFAAALETAFAGGGDAAARSEAVADAYLRFARENPAAYKLMFDLQQPDEDRYPDLVRATARARRTMTQHVEALIAEGLVAGDAEFIGHALWAMLHGAIVLDLAGKLPPGCVDRLRHDACEALLRGLAAAPLREGGKRRR